MTQDEIIQLAQECLIYPSTITDDNGTGMYATFEIYKASIESLQRFAALVAAYERKACAKVCEEEAKEWSGRTEPHEAVVRCAAAIRNRSNK